MRNQISKNIPSPENGISWTERNRGRLSIGANRSRKASFRLRARAEDASSAIHGLRLLPARITARACARMRKGLHGSHGLSFGTAAKNCVAQAIVGLDPQAGQATGAPPRCRGSSGCSLSTTRRGSTSGAGGASGWTRLITHSQAPIVAKAMLNQRVK